MTKPDRLRVNKRETSPRRASRSRKRHSRRSAVRAVRSKLRRRKTGAWNRKTVSKAQPLRFSIGFRSKERVRKSWAWKESKSWLRYKNKEPKRWK